MTKQPYHLSSCKSMPNNTKSTFANLEEHFQNFVHNIDDMAI